MKRLRKDKLVKHQTIKVMINMSDSKDWKISLNLVRTDGCWVLSWRNEGPILVFPQAYHVQQAVRRRSIYLQRQTTLRSMTHEEFTTNVNPRRMTGYINAFWLLPRSTTEGLAPANSITSASEPLLHPIASVVLDSSLESSASLKLLSGTMLRCLRGKFLTDLTNLWACKTMKLF